MLLYVFLEMMDIGKVAELCKAAKIQCMVIWSKPKFGMGNAAISALCFPKSPLLMKENIFTK